MNEYKLELVARHRPEVLERILRVARHRGFTVTTMEMTLIETQVRLKITVKSSQKEVIHSFFIAEDNIYAIGQLNSYHFAGSKYSETGDLIRILRSPYVKNISSVKIHSIAKDVEKNKVKATLTLYFNDKELTQKQSNELYGQNYYNMQEHNIFFRMEDGEIVDIKNKNEILKKAKLIKPLETKYLEYRQEKRFSAEATEDNITVAGRASAAMIIFVPLAIISLPFYAIQSLSGK